MSRGGAQGGEPQALVVALWWHTLPEVGDSADRGLLSDVERARADRFVRSEDAIRFTFVRANLRRRLAEMTGQSAKALSITLDDNRKPVLASGGAYFNVSHSHDEAVIAICTDAPLGVDVERIQPVEPGLVDQVFAPEEHAEFARLPETERLAAFYRCWCRKEAMLKGLGVGLTVPLDTFAVSLGADPVVLRPAPGAAEGWHLKALDAAEGYEAALAVWANGRPVRLATT